MSRLWRTYAETLTFLRAVWPTKITVCVNSHKSIYKGHCTDTLYDDCKISDKFCHQLKN